MNINIKDHAEKALESANSSSSIARNLFIGYVAIAGFIAVTLLSTDDIQILLYSPLKLPLLNIDIDLKGFYSLTPWIFGIVHLNLLIIFSILTHKLHHFESCIHPLSWPDRTNFRSRLHVFSLTQYVSGRQPGLLGGVIHFTTWLTVTILPIILVLWIQIDFLPAQEQNIIIWQRIIVVLECLFTFYFWHRIMQARRRQLMPKNWSPKLWDKSTIGGKLLFILCGLVIVWSVFIAVIPLSPWERQLNIWFSNRSCDAEVTLTSWTEALEDKSKSDKFVSTMTTLLSDKNPEVITDNNSFNRKCVLPATRWLHHNKEAFFPSHIDLTTRVKSVFINEIYPKEILNALKNDTNANESLSPIIGLNLSNRSLKFAILDYKSFLGASFQNSQLQGASIANANFKNTNFNSANLQGANLTGTFFQGANFSKAKLTKSNLNQTNLQGAILVNSESNYSKFVNANLNATNFSESELRFSKLTGATLNGAMFWNANLQGADLTETKLIGTEFHSTKLQGAILVNSYLQGTLFRKAILDIAVIGNSFWNGTYVNQMKIDNAVIFGVHVGWSEIEYKDSIKNLKTIARNLPNRKMDLNRIIERLKKSKSSNMAVIDGENYLPSNSNDNCIGDYTATKDHSVECINIYQKRGILQNHKENWLNAMCSLIIDSKINLSKIIPAHLRTANAIDKNFSNFNYSGELQKICIFN